MTLDVVLYSINSWQHDDDDDDDGDGDGDDDDDMQLRTIKPHHILSTR